MSFSFARFLAKEQPAQKLNPYLGAGLLALISWPMIDVDQTLDSFFGLVLIYGFAALLGGFKWKTLFDSDPQCSETQSLSKSGKPDESVVGSEHRNVETSSLIKEEWDSGFATNVPNKLTQSLSNYIAPRICLELIFVPLGEFMMGSPEGEKGRSYDEDQHLVTLTKNFWLGKHLVTQRNWEAVMGDNPSHFTGNDLPVENVSWEDAMAFCQKLNQIDDNKPQGYAYSLPTEAQWEYACRAGTTTATAYGDSLSSTQANFNGGYPYGGGVEGTYLEKTTAVGSYLPNAWGFYDMHGNICEWCHDWHGDYQRNNQTDPQGPLTGSIRSVRGGSWGDDGKFCRSAKRFGNNPRDTVYGLGFRLCLRPE